MTPSNPAGGWVGARLRALRAQHNPPLRQEDVAERAGISREVYNQLENGGRTFTRYYAEKIAPLYALTPDALLPPGDPVRNGETKDPLDLLESLSKTVAKQERVIAKLVRRVDQLEGRPTQEVRPRP